MLDVIMTSKCKSYCSVPQCKTYKSKTVSIHKFPRDPVLKKKWAIALRFGKEITRGMSVCSKHFLPNDFHPLRAYSTKRYLKIGVVPSQNIPIRTHVQSQSSKSNSSRISTTPKRAKKRGLSTKSKEDPIEVKISGNKDAKGTEPSNEEVMRVFWDKSVQADLPTRNEFRFHEYILNSTSKLNVFTGIGLKTFNTVMKLVLNTIKLFPTLNIDNIEKKICLILTKLKLDMSFRALAVLYEVSFKTSQNYFYDYIQLLYFALKSAIYFPSKEENLHNLPSCFSKYKNVRIILEATEVQVQRIDCLDCRIKTYSHHKKTHIAKFLIGVAPAGFITYVSSAYGGHVSDRIIFNNEKIIDLLDSYDEIMMDKGILIENECAEVGNNSVGPQFIRKKRQFLKEEAIETVSLVRARVHIERSLQRIEVFKIFSNKLEWSLVPYLSEMMVIVCALVNLSKPVLNEDKLSSNHVSK